MTITIIAEAGINHDGNLRQALLLCDAAKSGGADIVKFQSFVPEKCIRRGFGYDELARLSLSFADQLEIARHCRQIGIEFCSTPDDLDSLHFLVEECGVHRIKIGSGSLLHRPLVDSAFKTGLPVILSTGMATLDEISEVYCRGMFNAARATFLHCVSLYPCPLHLANVAAIRTLRNHFLGMDIGYSDHTRGDIAACAAVAMGAVVIEKHLTLDRDLPGPDHEMSESPEMFKAVVDAIRETEMVMGTGVKTPSPAEAAMIPKLRKDKDGFQQPPAKDPFRGYAWA